MKRMACLLLCVLGLVSLSACTSGDSLAELSQTLSVDLSQGTVVEETDTHGGFHGDGDRWVAVSFEDQDLAPALEDAGWQSLPLPQALDTLLYGRTDAQGSQGPYTSRTLPRVSEGYYFFRDRFPEAEDPTDPAEALERGAFNYTVALYDEQSRSLYYYEMDT